jgi:predicted CopG family antitoxin
MELIRKMETKNKNNPPTTTTITISRENCEKLKMMGTCGMSFNDVLTKILTHQQGVNKIDAE